MFDRMVQESFVGVKSAFKQPLLQEKLQNPPLPAPKQVQLCLICRQNNQFQKIVPLFNADKKYYTPSFYLQEEKKYYDDNDERVLRNHKLKVEQDQNSNQTIWVARHARKRNYCFVCKEDYDDYLSHTQDELHKKCLRSNSFTGLILELEQKFAQQNIIKKIQEPEFSFKRQAPTQESSSISISEQSPKPFQFIRKLSKPNQEIPFQIIMHKNEQI